MKNVALEIRDIMDTDDIADLVANQFQEWSSARNKWLAERRELRNYVFATDTRTTSANHLPWKNTVHIPKLCQLRDNLHANYIAAVFPHDRSIRWEGDDRESETAAKRSIIEAYMRNKLLQSKFRLDMSQALLDFIDYGNSFGRVEFVSEEREDPVTGETLLGYVGPKFVRINPHDITFDPNASDFKSTPKIIRNLTTLASLKSYIEDHPESQHLNEVFQTLLKTRNKFSGISESDYAKSEAFQMDGFGSWSQYMNSDYVEILDFYGDIYDRSTDTMYKNYHISIVDRSHVLLKEPNPSWLAHAPIYHVPWRQRPDNLYGMGPLDNLIGMQHRIDHLENAKADGYDLIIHPVEKVRGTVQDFEYGPGERIYVGDDGDVELMSPDPTMLAADTQISIYEQKMEEMAGAPKQAMGFRTPGEKTAYEVQVLENGANKVFLNKAAYFEEMFMEPILNAMLETSRRNTSNSELIRTVDPTFNAVNFRKVTKEDITARGKIRPVGARHFARNANIIQNLTQFYASGMGQDQGIRAHISGKRVAELMEELLDLERFDLVEENIQVTEEIETQRMASAGQQILEEENRGEAQALSSNAGPTQGPPNTSPQ